MRQLAVIIYIIAISLSSENSIAEFQKALRDKPAGERIAFWAERFVGTPYDTDPLGEYVRKEVIVADERVDCMYHVFRSAELALSNTPEQATLKALDMRFHTRGLLENGRVLNYDDRFQYGEDMIVSGKWGEDITERLGKTTYIRGSRGLDKQKILLREDAIKAIQRLQSGDIVFFIKYPEKRIAGEVVGHMGIIKAEIRSQRSELKRQKTEDKEIYLIHASGVKGRQDIQGESVKKVVFTDYLKSMKFIGIKVVRFEDR